MNSIVTLPRITFSDAQPVALSHRSSCREYCDTPLSLHSLATLLWAAQGERGDDGKRNAPSAGGMYPLAMFVLARNVEGVGLGVYRYQGDEPSLVCVKEGGVSLSACGIGEQPWLDNAAAAIIFTANIAEVNAHFAEQPPTGERGERYVYIETGAAAQNVQLQASTLDVGSVLVGGFHNDRLTSAMNLPSELEPTAILCLGNR